MNWLVLALISVVTVSLTNILQRALLREEENDPSTMAALFLFGSAFFVALFSWMKGFTVPPTEGLIDNYLILAVLYGLVAFFMFRAYKTAEASVVTVLNSSRALVTIVFALLFLGETFNINMALGTVLILGAIFLLSFQRGKFQLSKGAWYALAMAACAGVAVANDAYILRTTDALPFTVLVFLLPGVVLLFLQPHVFRTVRQVTVRQWRTIFVLCLFNATQALAFYAALNAGATASQLAPISQAAVVLTVLFAAVFLKERSRLWLKFLCGVMVGIGVVLLK